MARIYRRRLLQLTGLGAFAAGGGAFAAILASGRTPAYAQQASVHWLRWSDFVPASDQLLRERIVPECRKALGIALRLEMVNANDIQARVTAAIQSGTGPDIILALGNWPQLYVDSLADVSDVAEQIGADQGGYYPISKAVATAGGKWIGVPWCIGGGLVVYRKSWFHEIGYDKFPDSWDKLQAAGKILKAKGRPIGQALAHSFGDPPGFWYPWLWSWGGKEVEADGKTVALDSKATLESVKAAVPFWTDACDPGGLAWDDSSNNRAFLSGSISATNNGASIYIEGKRKPAVYLTENGAPMYQDMLHAPLPRGPGGQYNLPGPFTNMLMGYSKNQQAAKKLISWMNSKPIFEQWFTSQQGYTDGATRYWEEDAVWGKDPVLLPFRNIPNQGRLIGYAGPPGRASAEAQTKYIIVDMYAKAVQGTAPEDAVKWAHGELAKIYA
jgi:multiple sugar transport system substrate-binding protein